MKTFLKQLNDKIALVMATHSGVIIPLGFLVTIIFSIFVSDGGSICPR